MEGVAQPGGGSLSDEPSSSWPRRSSARRCPREHVAQIEAVAGRRGARELAAEGRVHDEAERRSSARPSPSARRRAGVGAGPRHGPRAAAASGSTRSRPAWIASRRPPVRERGLTVTNARGVFSRPIAEYVVMMSPGHRAAPAAAAGAAARADLAAAARRASWVADGRDRRLREHRLGGRPPAGAVRTPHPGHAPPSRPRRGDAPNVELLRPRPAGRGAAPPATSWSSPRR